MITLFDLSDLSTDAAPIDSQMLKTRKRMLKSALGDRYAKCKEVIGDINRGRTIHYVSQGEWSMHDLCVHVLNQIGPAHVTIATWSMSPVGCQVLINQIEAKQILSINALLDWRVKVRNPEALQLSKYNFNKIHVDNCHAKVTVLHNDSYHVSIVGSANYTNNPRIECGVITEDEGIATFHRTWINQCIDKASPFQN